MERGEREVDLEVGEGVDLEDGEGLEGVDSRWSSGDSRGDCNAVRPAVSMPGASMHDHV